MGKFSHRDDNADASRGGPLADVAVLDLSRSIAGAYAAKLLGDLGADVVKVEPPGGDPARHAGPFPPGDPDPEASAPFLYFNTSKRSVTLDIADEADRGRLAELVGRYDVVVADGPEGDLARAGIGLADLRSWNPDVVLTTISGFGSDGPHAGYRSTHLIACAVGGWADTCGLPDREPLQSGGRLTDTVGGAYAAVATLGAIEARARRGAGDHVDVSIQEAAITCALGPTMFYEYRQMIGSRNSRFNTGPSYNVPCGTGHIGVNVLTEAQWETLCLFIGRPEMLDDPRFTDYHGRTAYAEEILEAIVAAFAERDAEEVFHDAQSWRLPFGTVVSPQQSLALVADAERGYFEEHEHDTAGPLRTPRIPFLMAATPSRPGRPPRLGEHDAEVAIELAGAASAGRTSPRAAAVTSGMADDAAKAAPLAGLRVVDMTMFQAGPMVTLMASDLGADVIKIEAIQRLDGWRGSGTGGGRPWENSGLFNWVNRGKRGITLNLTDPRGPALVRQLVATADAVVENFTPRVMGNFGLDYESLRAITPDLVMLSMPGFGGTGSWRDYAAFAWTTEQMSTICHLTGYEDGGPMFTGTTCGDPLAGLMGAVALLSALHHRRLTGEGQHVDLSQIEACTSFMGDLLIEAQLTHADPGRHGNRSTTMAPHGIYPCRDDRWVAVACRDDEEWRALATAMGITGTALPHPTTEARVAAAAELDALVAGWTADQFAEDVMHRLQALGVPAGAVLNGPELLADRHLRARGFFIPQERADIGIKHHLAEPFRLADTPLPEARRAPYLGEFNREVLCDLLGVGDDEHAALERDHVIGTAPLGSDAPTALRGGGGRRRRGRGCDRARRRAGGRRPAPVAVAVAPAGAAGPWRSGDRDRRPDRAPWSRAAVASCRRRPVR